ncbi:MAG: CHAD domain-containing protein, partial [Actinobacteria bacterium]|nr:CHAD domain-containing protein [Actinomycetota bacterium]NIU66812.1 CHAD domain-containing protein [Actinomycetota bacterium]
RQTLADAIVCLGAAQARCAAYPIAHAVRDDFAAIAPGIARVYRRGHRAHRRARETRDVHDLHEWRKRVKYLRHQMEALQPLQPTLLGAQATLLDELGELLGIDHDHAVLAETVMAHEEA